MQRNYWIAIALGAIALAALPASAQSKRELWGQGRVEVVFGGGSPGEPCYDCDVRRSPRPSPFPEDRGEPYWYPERDDDRGRDRWKNRAESQREWEKDRREAAREWEKDRREAYREDRKRRQEWERERAKDEREAWKEWNKRQIDFRRN